MSDPNKAPKLEGEVLRNAVLMIAFWTLLREGYPIGTLSELERLAAMGRRCREPLEPALRERQLAIDALTRLSEALEASRALLTEFPETRSTEGRLVRTVSDAAHVALDGAEAVLDHDVNPGVTAPLAGQMRGIANPDGAKSITWWKRGSPLVQFLWELNGYPRMATRDAPVSYNPDGTPAHNPDGDKTDLTRRRLACFAILGGFGKYPAKPVTIGSVFAEQHGRVKDVAKTLDKLSLPPPRKKDP